MKILSLSITLLALLYNLPSYAGTTREAWEGLLSDKQLKQEAFQFVENDPELPNVLIYGDSISIGYTPQVQEQLKGRANVYRLHTNGGDSGSFIDKMTVLHETMKNSSIDGHWDFNWDVIHFNVGLHDLKYVVGGKLDKVNGQQVNSTRTYRDNLESIIDYLDSLAPEATLIFATTTPVPEGEPGRIAGDAARYNKVAMEVLQKHPEILLDDLYSFTLPNHEKWWTKPGNVHYTETGQVAQGNEVARVILSALQMK